MLANVRWVKDLGVDDEDTRHDAISLVPRAEAIKLIDEFKFAFTTRSGAEEDVEVETYLREGTTYLRTVKDSKDLGNIDELPVIIL